jgi:hypothetical protein
MGVLFLRIKLLRLDVPPDHAKAAHDALAVVLGFAGLILAFSLVQEQNYVRNLEAQVGAEANSLSRLDRLLVRFGEPGDDALRISLREYANSIVKEEWQELSEGRPSGRTTRLFREFKENVTAIDPRPGRQSLIFHAITIGVPPKRDQQAIANQATFDICQMTEQKLDRGRD